MGNMTDISKLFIDLGKVGPVVDGPCWCEDTLEWTICDDLSKSQMLLEAISCRTILTI
jgi:hypothetical protein